MIEELLFIHRFGVWDTVVCLAFVFFIISLCFSFGDIRLGWLSCFVWAEKSFLQLGVFNTQTLFEFFSFFLGGGGLYFFHSLGLEDLSPSLGSEMLKQLPIYSRLCQFFSIVIFYCIYRHLSIVLGVKWG